MIRHAARSRSRLGWILVLIGLPLAALAAVWIFTTAWRPVLHPDVQAIPSVKEAAPLSQWSEAVDRARHIIQVGMAERNVPGLSVAVGAGNAVVWAEGFGWADLETRAPVTPNTQFRIGTASTVLTSAAAGVLLERGRLRLNENIQTYVPQFPKKQWPVTLRQLMADVAGLGTDGGDEGPLFHQRCERPVEAVPYFAEGALVFEPGTQYRHSKYGWILVSAAVEGAGEQPFLRFLREHIFRPLRMDHTDAESAKDENPDRIGEDAEDPPPFKFIWNVILKPLGVGRKNATSAAGKSPDPATFYLPGFGPEPVFRSGLRVMQPRNLSCYAGSMAFLSTPSDLARFGLAINGGSLLQPSTVRLLQTSYKLTSGRETEYGLGWQLNTVTLAGRTTQAAGYDGKLLGRRVASLMVFREAGIVVAVMSNLSSADTSAIALQVAEAFARAGQ